MSLPSCLGNLILACGKSFHILTPFAFLGLVYIYIKNKKLFLLLAVMILSQISLVVKASDVSSLEAFLLPVFFFVSLLISCGLNWSLSGLVKLSRLRKSILAVLLICYAVFSLFLRIGPEGIFTPKILADNRFQNDIRSFNAGLSGNDSFIANFRDGVAFAFYTRTQSTEELETTMGNRRWFNAEYLDAAAFQELFKSGGEVYVMESYSPSPGASLLMSEQRLAGRFAHCSLKSKIENLIEGITLREHLRTNIILIYRAEVGGE
jgi:hypothetical protein